MESSGELITQDGAGVYLEEKLENLAYIVYIIYLWWVGGITSYIFL